MGSGVAVGEGEIVGVGEDVGVTVGLGVGVGAKFPKNDSSLAGVAVLSPVSAK